MKLYLVQHAEAKSKEEDPERRLTEAGVASVEAMSATVKPLDLGVGEVWHSGRARAVRTAELLAPAVGAGARLTEHDGLGPNDSVRLIADELRRAGADVMIVGHLPFLGKLASFLLSGNKGTDLIAFTYGCMACMERDDVGIWRLLWLLRPDLLDR